MPIPFNVQEVFGSKSRVAMRGTMNGFPFRNSLMPEGDGTHSLTVSRELQTGAGAGPGETVRMVLEKDEEPRSVELPPELEKAIGENRKAASTFAAMTYSQKKEYADWILGAKEESTRDARIRKAIDSLALGKKRLR